MLKGVTVSNFTVFSNPDYALFFFSKRFSLFPIQVRLLNMAFNLRNIIKFRLKIRILRFRLFYSIIYSFSGQIKKVAFGSYGSGRVYKASRAETAIFTHPIFESDFYCLTGKNQLHAQSPYPLLPPINMWWLITAQSVRSMKYVPCTPLWSICTFRLNITLMW